MRSTICAAFLLMLSSCAWAQTPSTQKAERAEDYQYYYCPQTHPLELNPSEKFFLDGTIGTRPVRMYLDRGGSGVVGLFFYLSGEWTPTELGGEWNNGNIDISDRTETHPPTVRLTATFAQNSFNGTWTPEQANHDEPVHLAVIPEPKCDGAGEWKRFDDPKWPISFSYPASWHIESDAKSITMTCPNPLEIAYDQDVTIYQGTGSPNGPTQLLQCGNNWIYGRQCDCRGKDRNACPSAKVNRNQSMTVLDVSEQEWRVYCRSGGYQGQGEGQDRVVLLDGAWLEAYGMGASSEIVDRLAGTARPSTPRKPK